MPQDREVGSKQVRFPGQVSPQSNRSFCLGSALLQNPCLKRGSPFPLGRQATGTISAVPSAEKRFIRAMRMWISA